MGHPWLIWEGVYGDGHHHGNRMRSDDLLANGKVKSDSVCPCWGNTTMKADYAESILQLSLLMTRNAENSSGFIFWPDKDCDFAMTLSSALHNCVKEDCVDHMD